MEEKFSFFWKGPLSQWHREDFVVEGVTYNTAEQYMMYQKAIFFKDYEVAARILIEASPKKQKDLGRTVKGFSAESWNKVARDIVYKGNTAKFKQNKAPKSLLLSTAGMTLVEASPQDRIWGIGLAEGDPLCLDRTTWNGTNWLGEVLTKVREDLFKGG